MARRHPHDGGSAKCRPVLLGVAVACVLSVVLYRLLWPIVDVGPTATPARPRLLLVQEECCKGIPHLELWGNVVKSASQLKANSSHQCCSACKDLCPGKPDVHGKTMCECNTWVYCGDPVLCPNSLGECWLKKQKNVLQPEVHGVGKDIGWTSGVIYGPKQGIVALEVPDGLIRIKLLPQCAPLSVAYILELLTLRHCAGCQFYRAEGRGDLWDEDGNLLTEKAVVGPPYALLQGTLAPQGVGFKEIPNESHQTVKRGMVGWVEGGPHFFISLANHDEWEPKHTIFGSVLPDDMKVVEELASLPTYSSSWSGVPVSALVENVRIVKVVKPQLKDKQKRP